MRILRKEILTCLTICLTVPIFSCTWRVGSAPAATPTPVEQELSPHPDFVNLARRVVPSVVNISTSSTVSVPSGPGTPDDLFRRFFEEFFHGPQGGKAPPNTDKKQNLKKTFSLGTGFIVDRTGLILTNNHVVADADDIKIAFTELPGEQSTEGKVVGRDAELDIALIRVKSDRKMVPLAFGDSESLQVGEYVIAVGNPFGQGHSVTHGIISAKGRVSPASPFSTYIQTDAPINPGNSGGPLINIRGEVIGINNAIDVRAQGIGFAIAVNPVKRILAELEKSGSVERGYLGVLVEPLKEEVAEKLGLKGVIRGPIITSVAPGESADRAGIKPYDVILEVDDKKIETPLDLISSVSDVPVGKVVRFKLWRSGKEINVKVKIGKRPTATNERVEKNEGPSAPKPKVDSGMALETLVPDIARSLGIRAVKKGVVVSRVESGSPAEEAGLTTGDVIVEVDQKEVSDVDSFYKRVTEQKAYLLRVLKGSPMGSHDVFSLVILNLVKK